ncbi:MAG TPA: VacJ family lipoprotein [Caulobacteraceae bacterium]|nr:VacJ family lipoprotein [Caulobacteraceae bacterium]
MALALAGPSRAATPGDPFEGFNRHMFAIEEGLDKHVFGPLSRSYGAAPSGLRVALRNWARNLGEPVIFANDLLQGRVGTAARTLTRFVVNSTFGLAGFVDVAKQNHLLRHENSFGTTLGRWGVWPGPYIFLPLMGPTTVRDGIGSAVDIGLNPLTYSRFDGRAEIGIADTVIDGLSTRVESTQDLEHIRDTSTDPYATLRSYFLQNRQAEISGKDVDINALPDLDSGAPTPPAAALPPRTPEAKPETPAPSPEASTVAVDDAPPDAAPDPSLGEDPSE